MNWSEQGGNTKEYLSFQNYRVLNEGGKDGLLISCTHKKWQLLMPAGKANMHKVGPVERTCSRPIFMKWYEGKNVDTMYEISAGKGRG